jgi:hypothetical protein
MTPTKDRAAERPGGRRRWHRAAIPLAVAAAVLTVTAIAYAVEQPDPADAAFLSPVSDAGIGARRLADRVRAAGVPVRRETSTVAAIDAAGGGDATLLIPIPSLVHRAYLRVLPLLPAGTRVVLVEPRAAALRQGRFPVAPGPRRWAAATPAPSSGGSCDLDAALLAGPAGVTRQRYGAVGSAAAELDRCYDGGLLVLRWGEIELVLAGASDPFRNDRIGEHGNAALTTGLLTARSRLVWLDLHEMERSPYEGSSPPQEQRSPSSDPDDQGSGSGDPGEGEPGDRGQGRPGDSSGERSGARADDDRHPLLDAFPAWFWALLAQLALAALLVALWRGRRLGPPVSEPLPVTVRSTETVRGRGRLYQRARARGPALDILRAATRTRLASLLGLPPDAEAAAVVEVVAARTGRSPAEVEALLYGPAPVDDQDLVRMAGELDALAHRATEDTATEDTATEDTGRGEDRA